MIGSAWIGLGAAVCGGLGLGVLGVGLATNTKLSVSSYTLSPVGLPPGFSGWRVVHLSDLHAARFGEDQHRLLEAIEELHPDAVMITGDLIDRRRTHTQQDMQPALTLLDGLAARYPTYRVDGNHEPMSSVGETFRSLAGKTAVHDVTDRTLTLTRRGDRLTLIGIPDVAVFDYDYEAWEKHLFELVSPHADSFRLVLSHRPQLFAKYVAADLPLVLSGHAHGGQWRLPLVGALFAPQQGIFPKYTEGVHSSKNTCMVISRGLGNSGFPLRLGNAPDIVQLTFQSP